MKIKYEAVWKETPGWFKEVEECEIRTVYIDLSDVTVVVTENERAGEEYCHHIILTKPGLSGTRLYVTSSQLSEIDFEMDRLAK